MTLCRVFKASFAVALLPFVASPSLAQSDIRAELTQMRALRILIQPFDAEHASSELTVDARELSRILRDDVEFSSLFLVLDDEPSARARKDEPPSRARRGRAEWLRRGANIVVTGELERRDRALVASMRLHDVAAARIAFATEFSTPTATPRRLAHFIADRILEHFGEAGIAQTRILFASDRESSKHSRSAIYEMDYDGFSPKPRSRGRFLELAPAYAPDGRTISFVSYPKRYTRPQISMIQGTKLTTLFDGTSMVSSPTWSPDGIHIAFASTHEGNSEIYRLEVGSGEILRLTHHTAIDVSPSWSPTGRELAFVSRRSGSPQIFTMDIDGLGVRRIPQQGSYNTEPAWSPSLDRSEIGYSMRVRGGAFQIAVTDLKTNRTRVLTSGNSVNESLSWAPNGRHIAFASDESGRSQIYVMAADGTRTRQLTFEGKNTTPSWGPIPEPAKR